MPSLIAAFIGIKEQIKVFHWQTQSYARHIAYGETYSLLEESMDQFIEVYMGKYGRIALVEGEDSINLSNIGEMEIETFLDTAADYFIQLSNQLNSQRDTDLLNIKDEMLATINKLKYLITLK
jgi:hypothetical protein